jgi:hypothetical protein
LWLKHLAALPPGERIADIMTLLSVSKSAVKKWTKDARQTEKEAQQALAWDLWLNCLSTREIEGTAGIPQRTVNDWLSGKRKDTVFAQPPGCESPDPKNPKYWGRVQHFDIWQFQDGGEGRIPPQVIETCCGSTPSQAISWSTRSPAVARPSTGTPG